MPQSLLLKFTLGMNIDYPTHKTYFQLYTIFSLIICNYNLDIIFLDLYMQTPKTPSSNLLLKTF